MLTEFMSDWRADESSWSDSRHQDRRGGKRREQGADFAMGERTGSTRAVEAAKPLSAALLGDNGAAAEAAGEATRKRAASLGLTL